jgi:hypothetical protein
MSAVPLTLLQPPATSRRRLRRTWCWDSSARIQNHSPGISGDEVCASLGVFRPRSSDHDPQHCIRWPASWYMSSTSVSCVELQRGGHDFARWRRCNDRERGRPVPYFGPGRGDPIDVGVGRCLLGQVSQRHVAPGAAPIITGRPRSVAHPKRAQPRIAHL